MKKLHIICMVLFFVVNINRGFSQPDSTAVSLWTIYPGYVITHEDDTICGYLKLSNLVANQHKLFFYNNPDDEEYAEKYKPKEIKGYKVGTRIYKSFKYWPTGETNSYHFFLEVIDGPISLYQWYYEPESRTSERVKIDEDNVLNSEIDLSFSENDLTKEQIIIKLDNKPINFSALKFITNFKKNMSKLVEDNEELSRKIANREEGYQLQDDQKIILEYNVWYFENKKDN